MYFSKKKNVFGLYNIHSQILTSCQQISISTFTFINGFIVGFWKKKWGKVEQEGHIVTQSTKKTFKKMRNFLLNNLLLLATIDKNIKNVLKLNRYIFGIWKPMHFFLFLLNFPNFHLWKNSYSIVWSLWRKEGHKVKSSKEENQQKNTNEV